MDFMAVTVLREAGFEAFDVIAGGETAGIPFAALLAERLALPMAYVRKKPKGYGRNARIEGPMGEGDRVLLVEDLATDGGSKLSFVEAIRETGATCGHTAVIFSYGIFPETVRAARQPRRARSTRSAPGPTCSPRRAAARASTTAPSRRSRPSLPTRAAGRTRTADLSFARQTPATDLGNPASVHRPSPRTYILRPPPIGG